ncbi:SEL1-like repeat protein [Beggiatoa leptomitoformis]|uniref:Sel1 repeat family protein n=1 Tax=Beggiatoa leptomitoformis TaxID=288004 RepID=A0A2N9YA28_9GAMM|nr:SEL1-like repeat protein [Beggiatoa leptomitoformis]AUI67315.1 hypothetical protein BLE401_00455 [Beggiatoa leptomitoformis]QGX03579.1 hypothetical protein AL038_18660 [Beggiatoa leptomitoformis]
METPPSRKKPKEEQTQEIKVTPKLFKQWEREAKKGNAQAQFMLGFCYLKGKSVSQNHKKAVEWFEKAANQEHAQAQFILSIHYLEGKGVAKSYEKAFEWLQKAANQGDAQAQYNLGVYYEEGKGVAQSYEKAFEWFQKAANQGDAQAQRALGSCYNQGKDVAQSYEKAFEWFQKAANQGDAQAQYNLGIHYLEGKGVAKSYEKAFEWFQKAAQQTNDKNIATLAQYRLARAYKQGEWGSVDFAKAKEYLREITDDKEVNSNLLEEIQGINEENQEAVMRFIRQTAMNELIDIERQEAKEKADKEMLSFLTHTLNNSLGTVNESMRLIIKDLGTNYEQDPQKFEAVLRILSLSTTFSITSNLINTFKQYITDPNDFITSWQEDNTGQGNIQQVLAFSLQQTLNRLFFQHSNDYLNKFFPHLTESECDTLRQSFIKEIVIMSDKSAEKRFEWIKKNFDIFEISLETDTLIFKEKGKRFTFFFSIFSELIYNAIRYSADKPIKIYWTKENEFYCFSCQNTFVSATRYTEEHSKKGLSFIEQLLTLLKQSTLIKKEENEIFTVTMQMHQDNLI